MAIPNELLPTTCDIYRPFGAAAPSLTNVRCQIAPDLPRGQSSATAGLLWTHVLTLDAGTDVRDGCTRLPGGNAVSYADGDEIRIPTGASTPRYVVVWAEAVGQNTPRQYVRAYLMRHAA